MKPEDLGDEAPTPQPSGTSQGLAPLPRLLQQYIVIGALNSLRVALADHDHQWTDGERAIYELAVEVVESAHEKHARPNELKK